MDHKELAVKLKKHDESALDRIIEIFTPMVWAIAVNISGSSLSREDIEEVVSDVFVTLWKNADKYDPEKLKGYIAAIAKTRTRNRLAALKNISFSDINEIDVEDDFSVSGEAEKSEMKAQLAEAVNELEEPDREILIRHYFYYQKTADIADSMGLTQENVKVKLHRTRNKLKKILTERGFAI